MASTNKKYSVKFTNTDGSYTIDTTSGGTWQKLTPESGFINYTNTPPQDDFMPPDLLSTGRLFGDSAPSMPDQDGYWALVELVDGKPDTITGYKISGKFWSYWDDESKHVIDTLPKGLWLFIS